MLDERFVYLVVLLNALGFSSYLIATVKGRARPNRVTWFVWALAPLVAFGAELGEGVGPQALMTFMVGFGPAAVLVASFVNPQAAWRISRLDLTCGALSLVALGIWLSTGHGQSAIALTLVADLLASLPMIGKAYRHPRTEAPLNFWLVAAGGAITLLTIDVWTFAHYGFPLYILAINALFAVLITFRLGERVSAADGVVRINP